MDSGNSDDHHIVTELQPAGARSTLKARRQRRSTRPPQAGPLQHWPADWRQLLCDWLKSGATGSRWTTLLRIAGNRRVPIADSVRDALLELGWILLDEQRERGVWSTSKLTWIDADGLRESLGLPRRDALLAQREQSLASVPSDPRLHPLHATLPAQPPTQAIARAELLRALDRWLAAARSGTRRDFALFARGHTKAISAAEWAWLESELEPEDFGITRHLPAIWLRAPLALQFPDGRLDLQALVEPIALTPATLAAALATSGRIGCWRVIENRTSFERIAAAHGDRDGVLWVPGFAPHWWSDGVAHLLRLQPAPARIACDPDPAGIAIALGVGALWQAAGLDWQPSAMGAGTLAALSARLPLDARDRERLIRQRCDGLPPALDALAADMLALGCKGEQEGLPLTAFD